MLSYALAAIRIFVTPRMAKTYLLLVEKSSRDHLAFGFLAYIWESWVLISLGAKSTSYYAHQQ